jgi:hypothetical protein
MVVRHDVSAICTGQCHWCGAAAQRTPPSRAPVGCLLKIDSIRASDSEPAKGVHIASRAPAWTGESSITQEREVARSRGNGFGFFGTQLGYLSCVHQSTSATSLAPANELLAVETRSM